MFKKFFNWIKGIFNKAITKINTLNFVKNIKNHTLTKMIMIHAILNYFFDFPSEINRWFITTTLVTCVIDEF